MWDTTNTTQHKKKKKYSLHYNGIENGHEQKENCANEKQTSTLHVQPFVEYFILRNNNEKSFFYFILLFLTPVV